MGELFQILASWIETLWPFRIVRQWEQGLYYICGKYDRLVGPGCYPVVPWFMDVHVVSIVPEMVETGRQDITLQDGSTLSFSASAWVRIFDPQLAVNNVDEYNETVKEILRAVLADKLASVDAQRLEPGGRTRLMSDLKRWVSEEANPYGIEVDKLRFTGLVARVRAFRLMGDVHHS